MLLVRLLLGLLQSREAGSPVPVIFTLASWDPDRRELDAWLAERLATDYPGLAAPAPAASGLGQATSRARALLDQHLIIPLLDGLDELPPHTRAVALDAVNHTLPPGPLVLTSRTAEYRDAVDPPADAGVPVRLTGAAGIELDAVPPEEVAAYLRRDAGGEGTPSAERWRPVLDLLPTDTPILTDTPIGEALQPPLALFLARTIYNPRPGERLTALPDPAELCDTTRFPTAAAIRPRLFGGFVPAAYRPLPGHQVRWTSAQAQQTLTFLARHLEPDLHGGTDLAWWQLRLAVPETARRLLSGTVLGAAMFLLTLLGIGLAIPGFSAGGGLGHLLALFCSAPAVTLLLKGWDGGPLGPRSGWWPCRPPTCQRDGCSVARSGCENETPPQYGTTGRGTAAPSCWGSGPASSSARCSTSSSTGWPASAGAPRPDSSAGWSRHGAPPQPTSPRSPVHRNGSGRTAALAGTSYAPAPFSASRPDSSWAPCRVI
jgi:hypothetical protein